jgi:hypothetical protein
MSFVRTQFAPNKYCAPGMFIYLSNRSDYFCLLYKKEINKHSNWKYRYILMLHRYILMLHHRIFLWKKWISNFIHKEVIQWHNAIMNAIKINWKTKTCHRQNEHLIIIDIYYKPIMMFLCFCLWCFTPLSTIFKQIMTLRAFLNTQCEREVQQER